MPVITQMTPLNPKYVLKSYHHAGTSLNDDGQSMGWSYTDSDSAQSYTASGRALSLTLGHALCGTAPV